LLQIANTCGNSASVYVNDLKADAYDFNRRELDISNFLRPGSNTLRIEVASTLNNRLMARNYHSAMGQIFAALAGETNDFTGTEADAAGLIQMLSGIAPAIQAYGLIGNVVLKTYTVKPVVIPTTK